MSEVIRYLAAEEDKYVVRESFIDFIQANEKFGSGLAEEIWKKL